jgi:ribosomal protein L40E
MVDLANEPPDDRPVGDVSDRALGRAVAGGLPILVVGGALTVGLTVGIGPALLVLAGGAILGTISLLWASLRTLSGDAPLAESLMNFGTASLGAQIGMAERKREALRALKDLEFEHSVGKIDDADFSELVAHYRGEAKAILREMDGELEPYRGRAEELAHAYLAKRVMPEPSRPSPVPEPLPPKEVKPSPPTRAVSPRVECPKCSTSNEPDAAFCKKCGTALRRACASCDTQNEPDAEFCKKCGSALSPPTKRDADVSA